MQIGITEAMKILKCLENSASTVKKPTSYILSAASRVKSTQEKLQMSTPDITPEVTEEANKKIARNIGWLNAKAGLAQPIAYNDVKKFLEAIELTAALKILKDLEVAAQTVENPTSYIIVAANKAAALSPEEGNKKIARQVGWLNAKGQLPSTIFWNEVREALEKIEVSAALKILKDLEVAQGNNGVQNPTQYVLQAARKAPLRAKRESREGDKGASSGGGYHAPAVPPSEVPSQGTSSLPVEDDAKSAGKIEEQKKIARNVGWLNAKGGLASPISYSDVKEPLGACDLKQALKLLKDLENSAGTVTNPTAYLISAAKRWVERNRSCSDPRETGASPDPGPPPGLVSESTALTA